MYRSNNEIYAQRDDKAGKTLAAATSDKTIKAAKVNKSEKAKWLEN